MYEGDVDNAKAANMNFELLPKPDGGISSKRVLVHDGLSSGIDSRVCYYNGMTWVLPRLFKPAASNAFYFIPTLWLIAGT